MYELINCFVDKFLLTDAPFICQLLYCGYGLLIYICIDPHTCYSPINNDQRIQHILSFIIGVVSFLIVDMFQEQTVVGEG
jgi:hypothetical protein